jgi:hypothetical protein
MLTTFSKEPLGEKAVQGTAAQQPKIPHRPKKAPAPETNGHVPVTNGIQSAAGEPTLGKRRRDEEEDATPAKKAKTSGGPSAGDEVVVVDDDGAILIDDD